MTVRDLADIAVGVFGGYNSSMPSSGLPPGASPLNQDIEYPEGAIRTRPGTNPVLSSGTLANIQGLKTYQTPDKFNRLLALDALGNLYKENPAGTLALVSAGVLPGLLMRSVTAFGREYMAFFNANGGADIPRQFDDTNFDRVSQVGPGAPPTATDFLPAAQALNNPGVGASVSIAAAPTGAVRSVTQSYTVNVPNYGIYGFGVYQGYTTQTYSYSTIVTITTSAAHGLSQGQRVQIAGVTDPTFNGTFVVASVIDGTHFTYAQVGTLNATSGAGTSTALPPAIVRANNVVTAQTGAVHGFQPGWTVVISGVPTVALPGTVSAIGQTSVKGQSGFVLVTMSQAHNLTPGMQVLIAGVTDTLYNGTWTIAQVPSPTTFIYAAVTSNAAPSAAGVTASTTFNGTWTINSVPTTTTFTYAQPGPDTQQSGGTATIQGNITAGTHNVSVCFITRQGFITPPSPLSSWVAGGGKLASVTGVPTGPANVVARLLIFTPAILPPATQGSFYAVLPTMQISDNTTTSVTIDFSDTALIAGLSANYLFGQQELGECAFMGNYNSRLVALGERNKVPNLVNLTFDGGWKLGGGIGGSDLPLGWTSDATNGAGGSRDTIHGNWLDAYKITGDGASANRGMVTQPAYQDYLGVTILAVNTSYSFRARLVQNSMTAGSFCIEVFSPTRGSMGLATVSFANIPNTANQEFAGALLAPQTSIPADTVLRVYGTGTVNNGGYFVVDSIEIFPTLAPTNDSNARFSYALAPESFDGVTGNVSVRPGDGQSLRAGFPLRQSYYLAKDHYLGYVTDDGVNEPSSWKLTDVSQTIGIAGPNAVDWTEEWAVFAERSGVYVILGGDPIKINQEIMEDASGIGKPCWNNINWQYGHTIWVRIDAAKKRILIGVPEGNATSPNRVWMVDYRFVSTPDYIASGPGVVFSSFTARLISHGGARKWSPWNISSPCCALSERSDGTARTYLGSAAGDGRVLWLEDGYYFDGVAQAGIVSFYQTHGVPHHEEEQFIQTPSGPMGAHNKSHQYLTGEIIGQAALPGAVSTMKQLGPGIVQVAMTQAHGLAIGDWVIVSGASDTSYNGWFKVQAIIDSKTFNFNQQTNTPATTGATVTGTCNLSVINGQRTTRIRGVSLYTTPKGDFERPLNVSGERVIYQIGTSVPGAWFQINKLIPSAVMSPTAPVKGVGV